jgi:pimeloyl-ACP methyl ester carboxylesterase
VKSPEVAFIVLLAGVGVPMEDLLLRQARDISLAMGIGEDLIARNAATQRELFRILRSEKDPAKAEEAVRKILHEKVAEMTDEQRKAQGMSDAMIEGQIKMMLSPWFRDMIGYDPRGALRAVKCPVLAINGEKDLQVAAKENLPAIREALAAGGNQRIKTVEIPGLNHLFQTCQTGAPMEYSQIEETFNPAALKLISDWIREVTAR